MRVLAGFVGVVVAASGVLVATTQNQLKTGKWMVEVKMEMPGMPAGMPPTKSMICMTEEQAKRPYMISTENDKSGMQKDCTHSEPTVTGNKLSGTISCQNGMVTGKYEAEFKSGGEAYTGTMTMNVSGHSMKATYDGKWMSAACDGK